MSVAATRWLLVLLVAWAGMFLASPAAAQSCTATATAVSFGNVATGGNTAYSANALVTLSCTGNTNQVIQYCPYIDGGPSPGASGPRYMAAGASRLAFDVYQDAALSQRYANGVVVGANTGFSYQLGSNGSGSTSFTVYGRIPAGQQAVPLGSYAVALSAGTQIAYAGGFNTTDPVNCTNVGTRSMTPAFTVNVSATNQASCTLATTPVQFGTVQLLNVNRDATASVSVTCSSGASFAIAMNGGANGGTSGTTRKMASGARLVTYGLYRDAGRATPWYSDAAGTLGGTGTGAAQSFTVYGRVPPQTTPAPGTYADTVIVTVTY